MKSSALHLSLAIVVIGASVATYVTFYSTVAKMSREVAAQELQIKKANENIRRVASARTALVELSGEEAKLQSYFISESGATDFVKYLKELGLKVGSEITARSVSKGGSQTEPILAISILVSGTFDSVVRTIGAIEYAPYAISFGRVAIKKSAENIWQADLTLSVGSRTDSN